MAESDCDDHNFKFDKTWWWIGIIMSSICLLYILIDYTLNIKIRRNPSRLMVSRAIFDYIAVIVVFYAISTPKISCSTTDDPKKCQFWGGLFLFSLYVPAIYYASICWQLYLTLKNPFRTPSSRSIWFHLGVLSICIIIIAFVANVGNDGNGQFEYRPAFQICFMKQRVGLNAWNVCIIYIPTFIIVIGGIISTFWSIKQLKRRIMDDTFELRWIVIKTQTAIITCFTINYVLQGINWIVIFDDTEETPHYDPYILSIFCIIAIVFDALTWFIRNIIQNRYSYQDYKTKHIEQRQEMQRQKKKIMPQKKMNNISDALRKEVIAFITAGLAQSVVMNSEKNVKKRRKRSVNIIVDDQQTSSISINGANGGNRKRSMSASQQLLAAANDKDIEFKKIGNFSKILCNPTITENYFLMSDEEKSDIEDFDENERKSKCELTAFEQQEQLKQYLSSNNMNNMNNMDNKKITDILSDKYYPSNIDGKYKEHVIEDYQIGSVGAEQTNVVFTDYAPVIFGYLRRNVYHVTDEQYKHSVLPIDDVSKVSLELIAKFSEGRSGAFFFFTKDMKYLIKTLTKNEAQLLLSTLKKYTLYITNNPETYLSHYFGLHSIKLYSNKIYFVVNKNVFPSLYRIPDEQYDIKGSWIDRHTNHHVADRKLMKDEDLHSKLVLNKQQSHSMYEQLKGDTLFLSSVHIMDYSLLLGIYYTKVHRHRYRSVIHVDIDENEEIKHGGDVNGDRNSTIDLNDYSIYDSVYVEGPGRYCIGIIDMLQKWNLNKKTERVIKGLRGKDRNGISAVPPIQYQLRFMEKMREIGIGPKEEKKQQNQQQSGTHQFTV